MIAVLFLVTFQLQKQLNKITGVSIAPISYSFDPEELASSSPQPSAVMPVQSSAESITSNSSTCKLKPNGKEGSNKLTP